MAGAGYTVLPQVIDGLVAMWTAELAPLMVVDCATTDGDANTAESILVVGMEDPDDEAAVGNGTGTQQWASLGALARDDQGVIPCAILTSTGETTVKVARDQAFDVMRRAELALKRSLGSSPWLGVPGLLYGGVGDVGLRTRITGSDDEGASGAIATLLFTVNYRARI